MATRLTSRFRGLSAVFLALLVIPPVLGFLAGGVLVALVLVFVDLVLIGIVRSIRWITTKSVLVMLDPEFWNRRLPPRW